MNKQTPSLIVANHASPATYYEGGHYELNLSFEALREKQWQRVMETIWESPQINGPLRDRYYPGGNTAQKIAVQSPPPTATLTQYGQLQVGNAIVGCDIQATRSLFECVSLMVPIAMFAGLTSSSNIRQTHPELERLDQLFYDLALHVYDVAPFKIAAIGYERECQLPLELRSDAQMRHEFLVAGNFLASEDVLKTLEPDFSRYEQVRGNLHWLPPKPVN
jgi:hypothetical protein